METIEYEFLSHRERKVKVSKADAYFAQAIIHYVSVSDDPVESKKVSEITRLLTTDLVRNPGILNAFANFYNSVKVKRLELFPSKNTLRYQDELYLRVCIELNVRRIEEMKSLNKARPEMEEYIIDRGLVEAVKSLS